MRAHTITTMSRRRRSARRRCALALVLGGCALAVPATAVAGPTDGDHKNAATANAGVSGESNQPGGGSDYSSVNSIAPPASEPSGSGGSPSVDSGYSSVNAISGAPASDPTLVSGSPAGTSDGFDWVSAAVGAGAAMALAALGGAALLTVRRRPPVAPPAPTS
jgi:hypothetical protein